jgi:hypothetical protein
VIFQRDPEFGSAPEHPHQVYEYGRQPAPQNRPWFPSSLSFSHPLSLLDLLRLASVNKRTFQRVKTDFPGIGDDLALLYAVKSGNDVANLKGLVPSILVFGTMPRLLPTEIDSELDSRTATNHGRYEAMKSARKEMTECIAKDKAQTACNSVPPPASSLVFESGQLVFYWRDKSGWKEPFVLSRKEGKTAFIHDAAGDLRPFNITQIKPFVTKDSDIFATNLSKVLQQYCLRDGNVGEAEMGISATEVVNNHDPRS